MALDALLADYHRQGQFSGSALVRLKGQTLLDRGYGAADRANARPNTPETAFQLASVSKQLTAAAILLLQEQGALSVQDSLATWVPTCPAAWKPITLHHLLTHTSGLVHVDDLPGLDFSAPYTQEDLRRLFQQPPLKFPPGQGWAYSSPGYTLLAQLVEQIAGESYARFLQHQIFQPLGLTSTGVGNHAPHPDQQALGYAGEVRLPSFALDAVGRGAGDIWSTTRELAQWDSALAAPGLLSSDSLQALFAPQAAIPDDFGVPGLHYGYGWFVGAVEGHWWRYHGGANAGFTSMNLLVPDHHCVVILLANDGRADLWRISHRLVADLLGETGSAPSMVQ